MNKVLHGDCLELMKDIPDGSIDMILCDLPYEVLNKNNENVNWDRLLCFKTLWNHYERVIKDNGAIVLTAQGLFTVDLINSNRNMFRYGIVWDKVAKTGFLNANRMPLRQHEDICIFYKKLPVYNPQMTKCEPHKRNHSKGNLKSPTKNSCYGDFVEVPTLISDEKFPTSILTIPKDHKNGNFFHPTQKPIALFENLIKTYTNENDLVLDNCAGSGTTGIACLNTNRNYILMEKEEKYFEIINKRISDWHSDKEQRLF